MKCCELCGEELKTFGRFYRNVGTYGVTLCEQCALTLDKCQADDVNQLEYFINWSERILADDRVNELYRGQIQVYNKNARDKKAKLPESGSQSDTETEKPSHHVPSYTYSNNVSNYLIDNDSNGWISISKFIGYLGIILYTGIGFFIGYQFDHVFIGGLVGFFVGMLSCSFLLMITSLCEDVSIIKRYFKQMPKDNHQ